MRARAALRAAACASLVALARPTVSVETFVGNTAFAGAGVASFPADLSALSAPAFSSVRVQGTLAPAEADLLLFSVAARFSPSDDDNLPLAPRPARPQPAARQHRRRDPSRRPVHQEPGRGHAPGSGRQPLRLEDRALGLRQEVEPRELGEVVAQEVQVATSSSSSSSSSSSQQPR